MPNTLFNAQPSLGPDISDSGKAHIKRLIDEGHQRIERIEVEGRTLWIKRLEGGKTKYWYWLQVILSRLLRCPMLRPAASRGGASALERDAARLGAFRSAGQHVPELVVVAPTALVTSDIGVSLQHYRSLKTFPKDTLLHLFCKAGAALGALHAAGLAHGRPLLRDLTWDGARIGFLDLEETPEAVMPLAAAQARDVVLFFVQLARSKEDAPLLPQIFAAYRPFLSSAVTKEIRFFLRRASPILWLAGPLLRRHGGRDGTSTILALDFLRGELSKSS